MKIKQFIIKIYNICLYLIFILTFPILIIKKILDKILCKIIYFRKGNIFYRNTLINEPYISLVKFNEIKIKVIINSYYDIWRTGNFKNFFLDDLFHDASVKKKLIYYDIGANTGYSSIIASKKLSNKIEAFAIELEPANYKTLCDNIIINNLNNIFPINIGLGNLTEIKKFYYNKINTIEKRFFYPLSSIGLHSTKFDKNLHDENLFFNALMFKFDEIIKKFNLPQPTHIFIDAFGSEKNIIFGMEEAFASGKLEKIYLDIEDTCDTIEETWIFNFLKNKNFKLKSSINKKHNFAKSNWNAIFVKI